MTKASLGQGKQILDLLSKATHEQVQNLIENGSLLLLLLEADLKKVDEYLFLRSLGLAQCWALSYCLSQQKGKKDDDIYCYIQKKLFSQKLWTVPALTNVIQQRFLFNPLQTAYQHPKGYWYIMRGGICILDINQFKIYPVVWKPTLREWCLKND